MKKFSLSLAATLATVIATLALSANAFAQIVTVDTPTYSGTGCPAGTLESALSPDGSSLSIIFDAFTVEAGGTDPAAKSGVRKTCVINLNATAPAGYRIQFLLVDYRGFAALGKGGRAGFTAEHRFGDPNRNRPIRTIKDFAEGFNDNFEITHPLDYFATPCGGPTAMSFSTSLLLYAQEMNGRLRIPSHEVSQMGLDSGDLSNEPPIFVKMGLEKCQ